MSAALDSPETRNAVIDNYNRYAEGLDSKNWSLVRSCFADRVFIDYGDISDPTGASDVARQADDWMMVLQSVINGFDITRHTITNHRLEIADGLLSCRAYLTADHVIFANPELAIITEEEVVTVVGEYNNRYEYRDGLWQICYSALVVNYTRGNLDLMAEAMRRAAA